MDHKLTLHVQRVFKCLNALRTLLEVGLQEIFNGRRQNQTTLSPDHRAAELRLGNRAGGARGRQGAALDRSLLLAELVSAPPQRFLEPGPSHRCPRTKTEALITGAGPCPLRRGPECETGAAEAMADRWSSAVTCGSDRPHALRCGREGRRPARVRATGAEA